MTTIIEPDAIQASSVIELAAHRIKQRLAQLPPHTPLHPLQYTHPALLERLEDQLNLSPSDANELLHATLQFLTLSGYTDSADERPIQLSPPHMVDECWHHFLLHSKPYHAYCVTHFGTYIHHTPHTRAERASLQAQHVTYAAVDVTITLARAVFGEKLSAFWASPNAAGVNAGNCNASNSCYTGFR